MSDNSAKPPEPRKPRAIRLDDIGEEKAREQAADSVASKRTKSTAKPRKPRTAHPEAKLVDIPDEAANGLAVELTPPPPPPSPRHKRISWGTILVSALAALVSLSIGLWAEQLIRELLERNVTFGYLALGLTALVVVALLVIMLREVLGLVRMRKINQLREEVDDVASTGSLKQARKLVLEIGDLCESLPGTAAGRAELKQHANEVLEPSDLLALAETHLMKQLDHQARALILNSAKRVSIVTAVSPRAIVDILFVLGENLRLIRLLSELYGGRPGTVGLFRLARMVITHLAATGAIAVGDGIVQQFIGHGLAAKLSSRLGEGVINGLLTARIGISAMDVCRPMPFSALKRPGVSDFLSDLARINQSEKND